MQEAEQTEAFEEKHPMHAKLISLIVSLVFLSPLVLVLVKNNWGPMGIVPLAIIVLSILASIAGVWRISCQLVTVIREGGDSDFRER
ncbi:hypothetical protein [Levilactobacillus suantsaiihabitans]|uniref:Uncharacterized protein n=1 Tax=Levilactobacillus suantsaiihabitans TaxID=2487722 RepID=A0A4Z0J8W4_9LACO|nr:hypothetical protein [Levilactobacillus suantsaiihabitans]TGD19077.1 hypothetical protein EGT51_05505 [Levilactobacillus suantsaiihabitans]